MVAVSWKDDAPALVEIFEDGDGGGELGRSEPVVLEQVVERGVEVPPVAPAGDRSLRVSADGETASAAWNTSGRPRSREIRASGSPGSRSAVSTTPSSRWRCGTTAVSRPSTWAGTGLAWHSRAGSAWALAGWDSGSGPTLYASGLFTAAGGQASSYIAAYRCPVGGLLFADGLESGDTGAWSAAVPGAPRP